MNEDYYKAIADLEDLRMELSDTKYDEIIDDILTRLYRGADETRLVELFRDCGELCMIAYDDEHTGIEHLGIDLDMEVNRMPDISPEDIAEYLLSPVSRRCEVNSDEVKYN